MPAGWMIRAHTYFTALALSTAVLMPPLSAQVGMTAGERAASQAFDAAKKLGRPDLYAFLKPMPKGAELHFHLTGSVYAETLFAEGVKAGSCIDPVAAKFAPPVTGPDAPCGKGNLTAADAVRDEKLYGRLIDQFSMRGFVAYNGFSGRDKFFSEDRLYGPTIGYQGEWLAGVVQRGADQNEIYMEIMTTPALTQA